jgi:holo-[acyl-carrier protein] synthase
MIAGLGIDIVDIRRIKRAVDRFGSKFTERLFTEEELLYSAKKRRPEVHLAARFAAKEAFFKALGIKSGIRRFKDVSVSNDPNGAPKLKVNGLDDSKRIHLSISHDGDYSVAEVIVEEELQ